MRRTPRTLFALFLLTALLFGGMGAHVSITTAQAIEAERTPRGNDKLFTPLPHDDLFKGEIPKRTLKTLLVRVPNPDSNHDLPDLDLKTNERLAALGFLLTLEQQIDYMPQIHQDGARDRLQRYQARLRASDVPRAGTPEISGKRSATLDRMLTDWRAELIIAVSFTPGTPARGLVYRYTAQGVDRAIPIELGRFSKETLTLAFETIVKDLCHDIGASPDAEGKLAPVPHAPVPRLVTSDKALAAFARMRVAFESGDLDTAWVEYEDVLRADPRCGRIGLYGIEIFRAIATRQTTVDENMRYNELTVSAARRALEHSPNDVFLRGLMSWYAATHLNRFLFGQEELARAMTVQPANVQLMHWWVTAYEPDDYRKQVNWLIENGLPRVKDGRIELKIAEELYGRGALAESVEWYNKALKLAPRDFELNLGLGMCATHLGEQLLRGKKLDESAAMFETATKALATCQEVDPQEVPWVYEFYVRAATHSFTHLPTNSDDLDRLFLTQAAVNGLESSDRTFQWDRLVKNVLNVQKRLVREAAAEAKPGEAMYETKLIVHLRMQHIAGNHDGVIHTLWVMHNSGLRSVLYLDLMTRLAPLVHEYKQ